MYVQPQFSCELSYDEAAYCGAEGMVFLVVAVIFVAIECINAWQQYFDNENKRIDGLVPGAFQGYVTAPPDAKAVLEFFGLFVANGKPSPVLR